jgi:CIC family chloride channel protein
LKKKANIYQEIHNWRLKHISEKNFLLLLSIAVGIVAGLAAILLKTAVHQIHNIVNSIAITYHFKPVYFLFPLFGIILTTLFLLLIKKSDFEKGLSRIIYSVSKKSSELPRHATYSHIFSSALTVGFGGSAGLEAPIVFTGSAIGSNMAKDFYLNRKAKTLLLGCGAAAGISAIFNSPIAGVVFALEVILIEVSIPSFIPILISSAAAAILSRFLYSGQLFFLVTTDWKLEAIPFYIVLGFSCGMISAYMISMTSRMEKFFKSVKSNFRKALFGGIALGLLIFIFPPLYGEGYLTVEQILAGNYYSLVNSSIFNSFSNNAWFVAFFAGLIVLVKVFATSITIGSGGNGGIFAPSLFTGALVGFFVARFFNLLGIANLNETNFIAVGMAGILSGVVRAPLTGIFLIAEVTGGYMLIIPLMIVSAFSFFLSRYFEPYSVYTKVLAEEGRWSEDKDKNLLEQIDIKDLVEVNFTKVKPNDTIGILIKAITTSNRNIFPVVDMNECLKGIVPLDSIREYILNTEIYDVILVQEVMIKPAAIIDINESMFDVMKKFEQLKVWNLPVMNNGKYIGFVSKSNIFNTYRNLLIEQTRGFDSFE